MYEMFGTVEELGTESDKKGRRRTMMRTGTRAGFYTRHRRLFTPRTMAKLVSSQLSQQIEGVEGKGGGWEQVGGHSDEHRKLDWDPRCSEYASDLLVCSNQAMPFHLRLLDPAHSRREEVKRVSHMRIFLSKTPTQAPSRCSSH